MAMTEINVRRFSVTSSKKLQNIVAAFEAAIGHPDMDAFRKKAVAATTFAELETIVREATGPSDLMEFTRMNFGMVLRKQIGDSARQSIRFVVGNPLVASAMIRHVPDAGSYVPVTILIDEREDGVRLSYDRTSSFVASYGNSEVLKVAQDLDSKVEALLTAAASETRVPPMESMSDL